MRSEGRMSKKQRKEQEETGVDLEERVVPPRLYKVILHNDDYTTMGFVIEILVRFFRKNEVEATELMLAVHHKGHAVAGIYTYDIAETKVHQVTDYAREQGHPFLVTMEPE